MGIVLDGLSIVFGCLVGSKLRKKTRQGSYHTLGIGIMIVSLVGCLENMFLVDGNTISGVNLLTVLFAYLAGSWIGEGLGLETRLSNLGKTDNASRNAFMDTALFFGVGGLQISGPIALAMNGDNSQLFIKSFVDLPFALAFGGTYGPKAALAAIPVALLQLLIVWIARLTLGEFGDSMIAQLCAMGYIILFFSGMNLMTDGKHRIPNINMLPGILLVIVINMILRLAERLL